MFFSLISTAQTGLIVNEVSQGTGGTAEWVELVVIGNCGDVVNLQNWIIDDNNGIFTACGPGSSDNGTFGGHGVASGHIRFNTDPT